MKHSVSILPTLNWGDPVDRDGEFLLPAGTATFLLADVEGSTRLWETVPETAAGAMAELGGLVADLVGRHHGVRPLEQGEGDSFVAAFTLAGDAVTCAVEIQARSPVPLRIGIHTGDAQRRPEGTFVGPTLNRAARIRDAGHGGQVLLSRAAVEVVADRLPAEVALVDLGTHRLRDLTRPEHVFQLTHPTLRSTFPPLRTLDTFRHNLPVQRSSLVGRHQETADVIELVRESSLVTLTGAGGCGKTRLAVHAAGALLDEYPDGVVFVDLAAVSEPDGVGPAVAIALGLGDAVNATDAVVRHLRQKTLLLVLDNCEHLVVAVASLADQLLDDLSGSKILATSREPLGVSGEATYRVPSLPVPPEGIVVGVDSLGGFAAAELFLERARQADHSFSPDSSAVACIADICRRLDGIPLAIELAAARVRVLSPAQIAAALDERFALLTGGRRVAVPRQQTLRASIDWSFDLLTEPERLVFERLAVFPASFTLAAAADVCAGDGVERHQVLDLVTLLVDKSLVIADTHGQQVRYRLLETLRQYAKEHLRQREEELEVRRRFVEHYTAMAEREFPHPWTHNQAGVAVLLPEADNVVFALRLASTIGEHDLGCRLLLSSLVMLRGRISDVHEAVERYREVLGSASQPVATRLRAAFGHYRFGSSHLGDFATTEEADHALVALRQDPHGAPYVPLVLAAQLRLSPALDEDAQRALVREAVAAASATGSVALEISLRVVLRTAVDLLGPTEALEDLERLVERREKSFNSDFAMIRLLWLLRRRGELRRALEVAELLAAEANNTNGIVSAAANRASLLLELGSPEEARPFIDEYTNFVSQEAGVARGDLDRMVAGLEGHRALVHGDVESACALLRVASVLNHALLPHHRVLYAHALLAGGQDDEAVGVVEQEYPAGFFEALPMTRFFAPLFRGATTRRRGDLAAAEAAAHDALADAARWERLGVVATTLELLAGIAGDLESHIEAARLIGAAEALRERTGGTFRYPPWGEWYAADRARSEAALGSDFEGAFEEGRRLSVEEAVAYASRGRGERKRPSSGWASLTPAERQVVDLVAEGLSNKDVAARLFISSRTVAAHLSNAFAKLGVSSRTELAANVHRR